MEFGEEFGFDLFAFAADVCLQPFLDGVDSSLEALHDAGMNLRTGSITR